MESTVVFDKQERRLPILRMTIIMTRQLKAVFVVTELSGGIGIAK